MKKRPQSLSAVNRTDSVDKKLAGGLLALALIGGTGVTTYAADANGGGYSPEPQASTQTHR